MIANNTQCRPQRTAIQRAADWEVDAEFRCYYRFARAVYHLPAFARTMLSERTLCCSSLELPASNPQPTSRSLPVPESASLE
jgi:hypothetical protein